MPSSTEDQARFMAACSHGAGYESCPPQNVSQEFNQADKGTAMLKNAMKHRVKRPMGGPVTTGGQSPNIQALLQSLANQAHPYYGLGPQPQPINLRQIAGPGAFNNPTSAVYNGGVPGGSPPLPGGAGFLAGQRPPGVGMPAPPGLTGGPGAASPLPPGMQYLHAMPGTGPGGQMPGSPTPPSPLESMRSPGMMMRPQPIGPPGGMQRPMPGGPGMGPAMMRARGGGVEPPMPMESPLPRNPVSPLSSLIGGGMAAMHGGPGLAPHMRKPRIPLPGALRNINQTINKSRGRMGQLGPV